MVAVLSTVAGAVASDLEDHAAQGQLEGARLLVESSKRWARSSRGCQASACRSRLCDSKLNLPITPTTRLEPEILTG
jgi:hypothetical protein